MRLIDLINSPWAIMPEMLREISAIYTTHMKGEKIDIKGIEERTGKTLKNKHQSYEIVGSVGIVPIEGVISKKMNLFGEISGGASSELIGRDINQLLDNPDVKSIVLKIDSPGGTVDGAEMLADIVYSVRGKKDIVAYTDGMMASAAYWIGAAADAVFIASDTTQVGSIGVIATHVDTSRAEESMGVKTTEIVAGKYKNIASRHMPLSQEGKAAIQEQIDYIYSVFVNSIAKYRGVSPADVLGKMADGKIFIGKQAEGVGLVDGVSTLGKLIDILNAAGVAVAIKYKQED